jgi:hypothetical protein
VVVWWTTEALRSTGMKNFILIACNSIYYFSQLNFNMSCEILIRFMLSYKKLRGKFFLLYQLNFKRDIFVHFLFPCTYDIMKRNWIILFTFLKSIFLLWVLNFQRNFLSFSWDENKVKFATDFDINNQQII